MKNCALTALLFSSLAIASPERGLEIATAADQADTGWGTSTTTMVMVLKDQYGNQTERQIRNRTLEGSDEGDQSLVIFDSPGDVRGTGFLSHTKKAGSDDQWLYLPALKRVKRIASSNKAGPFMGSEFAYEDISSQEVEKYTYNFLRDETVDGMAMHVVERDPVDPKSGYSRQVVWMDQAELRVWKVEYYDRKNSLLKTLNQSGFQEYGDGFWRPDLMHMVNHQTGKETELRYTNWEFGVDLSANDFQKNALKRIR